MIELAKQIETELHQLLLLEHFVLSLEGLCLNRKLSEEIMEIFKDSISVCNWSSIQLLDYFGFEYDRFSKPQLVELLHKTLEELNK